MLPAAISSCSFQCSSRSTGSAANSISWGRLPGTESHSSVLHQIRAEKSNSILRSSPSPLTFHPGSAHLAQVVVLACSPYEKTSLMLVLGRRQGPPGLHSEKTSLMHHLNDQPTAWVELRESLAIAPPGCCDWAACRWRSNARGKSALRRPFLRHSISMSRSTSLSALCCLCLPGN
eukprot:9093969-Pyramimonas_sp.AAC.1